MLRQPPWLPCILPDRDPVFRRQIHSVAFLYIIGLHEFIELLHDYVGSQIVQGMTVVTKDGQVSLVAGIESMRLCVSGFNKYITELS